jgi:hypothetical protein
MLLEFSDLMHLVVHSCDQWSSGYLQARANKKWHDRFSIKIFFCSLFWLWQRCDIVECLNHVFLKKLT